MPCLQGQSSRATSTLSRTQSRQIDRRPSVLAVDDDDDNLLLLIYTLQRYECSLLTARDGKSALSLAKTHQPDLILLDLRLPDVNGIEILRRLRQHPPTSIIPVVAVTALARKEDRQQVLLAGGNGYVRKPYLLEELEATLEKYLRPLTPNA